MTTDRSYIMFDLDLAAAEFAISDWIEENAPSFTFRGVEVLGDGVSPGAPVELHISRVAMNGHAPSKDDKNGFIQRGRTSFYGQLDLKDQVFDKLVQAYFSGNPKKVTIVVAARGDVVPGVDHVDVDGLSLTFNRQAS